jgi:hypothetical protein
VKEFKKKQLKVNEDLRNNNTVYGIKGERSESIDPIFYHKVNHEFNTQIK